MERKRAFPLPSSLFPRHSQPCKYPNMATGILCIGIIQHCSSMYRLSGYMTTGLSTRFVSLRLVLSFVCLCVLLCVCVCTKPLIKQTEESPIKPKRAQVSVGTHNSECVPVLTGKGGSHFKCLSWGVGEFKAGHIHVGFFCTLYSVEDT